MTLQACHRQNRPLTARPKRVTALAVAAFLVAAALSIVAPTSAFAATAAYVQSRNTQVTSGTTAKLAFSKANTAGNLIVVYAVWDNAGTATVTDSVGNAYTAATARQSFGSGWSAQVFVAPNIAKGSNTVTATFGTAIKNFGILYLHEYSGLATVSPVDGAASAVGTSTAMSSGAVNTTQANDLLFAAGATDNNSKPGSGFTARLTGYGNVTEDRAVTSVGSYTGTATQDGSTWTMQLVALKVASAVGPATKLALLQGPSNTAAGVAMSPALRVAVEDASGNVETGDNATKVSLAIGTNPSGGTLTGGAAVTVVSGVATFSGVSINNPGTGYTLSASSTPSYTGVTSAAFNITGVGPATKLALLQGPSNTAAGVAMSPALRVAVEDASGNVETGDNATKVSLAIGTNPSGGTLTGGAAVTVVSGVATFSGVSINNPGTGYTLSASSTPSYTGVTSAAFNITGVGPATKLALLQGPSTTAAGAVMAPAVRVAVEDASGNVETGDNATQVSLAIGTNPSGGTLTGGAAVTVTSGVATFPALSINNTGTGYTLTASSTPSYTGATSAAFNITAASTSDWTSYLGGIDHTNYAAGATGFTPTTAQNLTLAWQTADVGPSLRGVFSQPIVTNGLVYWGSFDGYERATDSSGNLVWQTNLGTTSPPGCSDPPSAGISSTGTVTTDVPVGGASSVLYVGGGDSKLYALNAATGAVLWSYQVGPPPNYFIWSSPIVYGNSVYLGVASFGDCPLVQGSLIQVNRVTGALQNSFPVVPNGCIGGGVWGSPTLDATAGTIYFDSGNDGTCGTSEPLAPSLMEVSASDLSLLGSWTVPPAQQAEDSDFGATPTLFNGVIKGQATPLVGVINKNGVFYTFKRDALTAGPVWSTRIAGGGADPPAGTGDIASASFDGSTLYVGGDISGGCSGTVNALNPSTGAFIWQHCFTDGGFVLGGVTSTSGGVVAVGEGNNIVVVSAATGATVFSYAGTGPFYGPPTFANGMLYEGDMSGNLYALKFGPAPAPSFVQVNSVTPQSSLSQVSVSYQAAQTAGNLNVVAIGFTDATATITSVTDTAGNVYQVAAPLTTGSGFTQAIYYAKNINGAAAGNSVTVKFSASVPYPDIRVLEYHGLDTVNPLDTSASAVGTSAPTSSGNLTTSGPNELVVGAGYTSGVFTGGTNGLVSRIITPIDSDIAGDKLVATAGVTSATASQQFSAIWVMQAVAFRGP
jgi:outer membrane protein assembly factor BamB